MKRLVLGVLFFASTFMATAQDGDFNLGAQIGIPTGDAGDFFSVALGVDANYLFEVDEKFKVGPATSLLFYLGKDDVPNSMVLPIAGAARFNASDEFVIGLDMGYGIGINNSGNDFYFKPQVGYQIKEDTLLYLGYTGFGDGGHFALGAMFQL